MVLHAFRESHGLRDGRSTLDSLLNRRLHLPTPWNHFANFIVRSFVGIEWRLRVNVVPSHAQIHGPLATRCLPGRNTPRWFAVSSSPSARAMILPCLR